MKLLFVCSLNKIRSLTAQRIFEKKAGLQVLSAGTQRNARVVISPKLIEWADIVFVMEREHEEKIRTYFPAACRLKKIICLDIRNGYEYMDPDLITLLDREVTQYVS